MRVGLWEFWEVGGGLWAKYKEADVSPKNDPAVFFHFI